MSTQGIFDHVGSVVCVCGSINQHQRLLMSGNISALNLWLHIRGMDIALTLLIINIGANNNDFSPPPFL